MVKACGRAACLVSEGEGAVLGASGTSMNGRARMPKSSSRAMGRNSGVWLIFTENPPKRITEMGKGILMELRGTEGTLEVDQQKPKG